MKPINASLEGKVAVITGGSGGLGAAIARRLADVGATVVAGYHRSAAGATGLVAELAAATGKTHLALPMPVTNSAAMRTCASTVLERLSRVDILVNCAGTTRFVPHADLDALDDDLIDEILKVNVRGTFAAIRAFRDPLTASGAGLVVNVTSVAAQTAMGSNIIYCASKSAVENMTRSLARALAPAIRVVSVAPGLVDTEFVKSMDAAWRDRQSDITPLGRLAQASEVADAVVAIATLLRFSTGTSIAVDGGRPLSL
jgi:3-oxoacyl-[acyl-carrier protein] reductase